ncbi:MAG: tetrahydromethanopterin S-methyltransferase subunit D [Methanosarcinales archaeon]|jgi:tetrahydromethanopterin S-methyltransferase subunit D|nr:MAG: tetrahydromethanopterin S-methyltransferase subunit D [ANME-2 cluster archaeon]MCD4816259.1 tetrahydromethanopterin S-methyltransferase subunit D [Methanosarcinales archaeon]MRG77675.1 tetrahydromethanopterin S-methyltransferase subunit D [ANME-2 cluster archaeon]
MIIDPISIALITLGGVLIGLGVHFIPVGGAPAAMAQATGVGTGTVQLAAGAGLTGLISAGFMYNFLATAPGGFGTSDFILVLASGAVGAMIMITVTMFIGQLVYVYCVGVPPVSAKVDKDPITGDRQDIYVSQGTEGHGVPTVSFVSGTIGGLFGGVGGSMVYVQLMQIGNAPADPAIVALAGIFATGVFYVNAVLASYNIGGTIEGFHDPKFKRVPKAIISCLIASLLCAIIAVPIMGGVS